MEEHRQLGIEDIAGCCHEANRAYCATLGDHTQVPWLEAPQWQRDSAVDGVIYLINNPEAEPGASHENWVRYKRSDGWTFGPEKDPEKKEHPCLVPFDQLPPHQRRKDHLFCSIVRALTG